jgi:peptidoglycan/xylan/chitin deacetylase (PgdA/CDA1 family)
MRARALAIRRRLNRGLKALLYTRVRGRTAAAIPVFAYHSVDESGSPFSVSPSALRRHLALLRDEGWRALSMAEYLQRDRASTARDVLLTFDDGYENFYTDAAPILDEYGFRATVFVVTDAVGRRPAWFARDRAAIEHRLHGHAFTADERRRLVAAMSDLAERPLLDWPHARELVAEGFDVQSHSASHRFLTTLEAGEIVTDLRRSRETLEDRLGAPVVALGYPYGAWSEHVTAAARQAGFRAGFLDDYVAGTSDPLRIERIPASGGWEPFDIRFALSAALEDHGAVRRGLAAVKARWRVGAAGGNS